MPAGGDFNSSMRSPGGSPSNSQSGAGGMGGGGGSGRAMQPSTSIGRGNLGITTGSTIHGNTAFGPAGGNAVGYATRDARSLAGAGMGPTMGNYSNFRTPSGEAMFPGGGPQGMTARSPMQAMQMLQALRQRFQPAAGPPMRQPGLLDDDLPAPPTVPTIPPNWPVDTSYGSYFMRNPTQRPYDVRNSPPRAYFSGTYPTGKSDFAGSRPYGKTDFGGRRPYGKTDFGG
jgi:hypothetical protein